MAGQKSGRGGSATAATPATQQEKTDEQIIAGALGTQGTAATLGKRF